MIETLTVEGGSAPGTITPRFRFQLDNHLGTCCVETDDAGAVISYEEYHPYGTSAYRAMASGVEVSARRYRYTGKERDDETGLYLMGARYYACWLARWTAADPAGTVDGTNLYAYVRGSPVGLVDPSGTESQAALWKAWNKDFNEALVQQIKYAKGELTGPPEPTLSFQDWKARRSEGALPLGTDRRVVYAQGTGDVPPDEGQVLSNAAKTRDDVDTASYAQRAAESRAKRPMAGDSIQAEMKFLGQALDPSGGGLVKHAVYGVSLAAGSTPEQAEWDAKLGELAVQAAVIGTGAVPGEYLPAPDGIPLVPEFVGTPRGFGHTRAGTFVDFVQFKGQFESQLADAGYPDVDVVVQGSSVTGVRHGDLTPFDVGRVSDLDVALASPELLHAAKAAGIKTRSGGVRTEPLDTLHVDELGLRDLQVQWSFELGRPVNFMLYDSVGNATGRSPSAQ